MSLAICNFAPSSTPARKHCWKRPRRRSGHHHGSHYHGRGLLSAGFTSFKGVAELGIIAGGGLLLCAVAELVLLPASIYLIDRSGWGIRMPNRRRAQVDRAVHAISAIHGGGLDRIHGPSWHWD